MRHNDRSHWVRMGVSAVLAATFATLSLGVASAFAGTGAVSYIDEAGNAQELAEGGYTDISERSFEDKVGYGLGDGWYIASGGRDFGHRMTITGDAKLILCDDARLFFKEGIRCCSGRLTIYSQSDGARQGMLKARASSENAAIGGNDEEGNGAEIVIAGGRVEAYGAPCAAGIGGGDRGGCGTIRILGGDVTAEGGYGDNLSGGRGAGIGSGDAAKDGGSVTISGGRVYADGAVFAAGIGTGDEAKKPVDVNIEGGTVTATGGKEGAGIGGGNEASCGEVKVSGGSVTARGGVYAAGIGGGDQGACHVEISGGTVNAMGGNFGAGIGTGDEHDNPFIDISGGEVWATGGHKAAGIGGGNEGDGGVIGISGGHVVAKTTRDTQSSGYTGPAGGAGIGGGDEGDSGRIAITGGVVEAMAIHEEAAAIGHGRGGKDTDISISDCQAVFGDTVDNKLSASERLKRLSESGYVKVAPCDHEFDGKGCCAYCDGTPDGPFFAKTTVDKSDAARDRLVFWVNLSKATEEQLANAYIEMELDAPCPGSRTIGLDECDFKKGDLRGYLSPTIEGTEKFYRMKATVHYGADDCQVSREVYPADVTEDRGLQDEGYCQPHLVGRDGTCVVCGYHNDGPDVGAELGEVDNMTATLKFWVRLNGLSEEELENAYLEVCVNGAYEVDGSNIRRKRVSLADAERGEYGEACFECRVVVDAEEDSPVLFNLHYGYGEGSTLFCETTLNELRAS